MRQWAMNNAIWLIMTAPQWFFATVMNPFAEGYASAVPAFGAYFLAIGVVLGLYSARPKLLLFLIPLALSVALIAAAGYMRGEFRDMVILEPGMMGFVCVQALLAVFLAYKVDGARAAAAAFAVFSVAHSLFATEIATMSFMDAWA